jgi:tetratricopeptide (TPR) repeat protein
MKRCPYCQKGNDDDEIQCWNCGEWFETALPPKQPNVVKLPKKEKIGIDSADRQTDLGRVFYKYRITIISIILIAGLLFIILQNENFNKKAEQVSGIEPPQINAPAEPTPATEFSPTPDLAPAVDPASAPGSAKNLFNNAFALCASGKCSDPQKVIEYLNEAIKLNPGLAQAHNNRGNAYGDLGQYQLAIEDYTEAIRLKPDYANAYSNRGIAYDELGEYQLAIEDLNEAIHLKPDYANAWSNRALTYLNHGNKNLGCPDAQKACELGYCKTLEVAQGKGMCR